ncbi:hemerythrin domain-containing protein [Marinicella rhabdoformis]|uniref:hemerythrin domain-containing protein n=1 Tax=Marinicella rhabdoformis TaxID=2580566 RepID=UPI0012AEC31E|nr:hemerythrin domain-containing protein [Marinicella rhabdoformis]
MNIYEAIKEDHKIQLELLDKLTDTSGDSDFRSNIFSQLKTELEAHANAEERFFYVSLIYKDSTQEDARHGIAEHHEIDEMIAQLVETDQSSSAWLKYAKNLQDKIKHHLAEEEKDYFPIAQKNISDDKAEELGQQYLQSIQRFREKL